MNVAVAAAGPDLKAPVDGRFGRCRYFVVVDTESMHYRAIDNLAAAQGSGAGIAAAQAVADAGADAVVAANLGPNAFRALAAGGLALYRRDHGTVAEAVEALKRGELEAFADANVPSHAGMGTPSAAGATDLTELRDRVNGLTAKVRDARERLDGARPSDG